VRVIAIVPAYNEADSVGDVVRAIRAVDGVDVAVVDDGSTDDTAKVAREAGARVLTLPINLGIGGAVQCGYLYAARGGYDVAVQGTATASTCRRFPARAAGRRAADSCSAPGGSSAQSTRRRPAGVQCACFSAVVTAATGRSSATRRRDSGRRGRGVAPPTTSPVGGLPGGVESLVLSGARASGSSRSLVVMSAPPPVLHHDGGSAYYVVKVLLASLGVSSRRPRARPRGAAHPEV
jgi:hypothetical protein